MNLNTRVRTVKPGGETVEEKLWNYSGPTLEAASK